MYNVIFILTDMDTLVLISFFIAITFQWKNIICEEYEYEEWIPSSGRKDLRCQVKLAAEQCAEFRLRFPVTTCCKCNSKPIWQIDGTTLRLYIEYTKRNGISKVIGNDLMNGEIRHQFGFLRKMPINLCNYTGIVLIDVSYNQLGFLASLSCLVNLDTLDVSYNSITYINNCTFRGMSKLRIVRMSNNKLSSVDPYTFTGNTLNIMRLDVSSNKLKVLDISNFLQEKEFCSYDFSYNFISELTNKKHLTLKSDGVYYGGRVQLANNNFNGFVSAEWFEKLGIFDWKLIGKLLLFAFNTGFIKLTCTCKLVPYLQLLAPIVVRLGYMDSFFCDGPKALEGESILNLAISGRFDELICDISEKNKCHRHCRCFEQPSRSRTIVDCSNLNLKYIPKYLPEKKNIVLYLQNNSIETIPYRDYLENVIYLDVSKNSVDEISVDALSAFLNFSRVNVSLNRLRNLNREFQLLDPCVVALGNLTISCGCNDVWIANWLRNKDVSHCKDTTNIICKTKNGFIPALELQREHVCNVNDYTPTAIVGTLLLLVFLFVGVLYKFQNEFRIISTNALRMKQKKTYVNSVKFDIYLSFDETDDAIRQWILRDFDRQLQREGYKTFISCRDINFGSVFEEEMKSNVQKCKNYVVFLCQNYLSDYGSSTYKEWTSFWYEFCHSKTKNIVIVNLGLLKTSKVKNSQLKAFLRLGLDLDFSNRRHCLLTDIGHRLGPPICSILD